MPGIFGLERDEDLSRADGEADGSQEDSHGLSFPVRDGCLLECCACCACCMMCDPRHRQCGNAQKVAEFLSENPNVSEAQRSFEDHYSCSSVQVFAKPLEACFLKWLDVWYMIRCITLACLAIRNMRSARGKTIGVAKVGSKWKKTHDTNQDTSLLDALTATKFAENSNRSCHLPPGKCAVAELWSQYDSKAFEI